jgi:hypothetical protein
MKTCPFCRGEIRDSVIRCSHCGRSLQGDAEADTASVGASTAFAGGSSAHEPPPPRPSRSIDVWATQSGAGDSHGTGAAVAEPALSTLMLGGPALPVMKYRRRLDAGLLIAGLVLLAAGILAYLSIRHPWVRVRITGIDEDGVETGVVARLVLAGGEDLAGKIGLALSAAMAIWGAVWCWYGFDRGAGIPAFARPGFAILVTLAGIGVAILCSTVWFVWSDAAVAHAADAHMTAAALRVLIETHPLPIVHLKRLHGLLEFGGLMVLGQLASCLAFWSSRRR